MKHELINANIFKKKFSVGLFLDTSIRDFDKFLDEFKEYIDNIYFSLPMGDKFHSRKRVAMQLHDETEIGKFWDMLSIVKKHGIKLEVLFNTSGLSEDDIFNAKQLLDNHNIVPELVGLIDTYYECVRKLFPDSEYVFSFNNYPHRYSDYYKVNHDYSEYVIGRNFIRDKDIYRYIHEKLQAKTVLLVNNGCSFICGGCSTLDHCKGAYYQALEHHSSAYLYALQSIMPFEILEGWIDISLIDLIKINSRNTNLVYVRKCLMSYIFGHEQDWITLTPANFSLWGHLTWHAPFLSVFTYDQIRNLKIRIYESGEVVESRKNRVLFYNNSNLNKLYLSPYAEYKYSEKNIVIKNTLYNVSVTLPLPLEEQKILIELLQMGIEYNSIIQFLEKNGLNKDAFEALLQGCVIE